MFSSFRRPETFNEKSYANPMTPADMARAVWDERVGSVVVQSYNWRRIAIMLCVICLILTLGLVYQSSKTKVIPYVVTVDKTTGEVQQAGGFANNEYEPQEAEIRYFLVNFIANARTIQLDPIAQNRAQTRAMAYLTTYAARKYQDIQLSENYMDKIGNITTSVSIVSVTKVPESTSSYQIRWIEEEFEIKTGVKETSHMSGVFTYTRLPVESEELLLLNPLGLFISGFDFTNDVSEVNRK